MSLARGIDRAHRGPRNCNACGKLCMSLSAYIIHERVHTRERPYSCEICGVTFPQKHHVARHMRKKHGITED